MKTNFIACLALAVLAFLCGSCERANTKKQQISTRPSLSTLAMANPLELGYRELSVDELLNSRSVKIVPERRKQAVAADFLRKFIVYLNDDNHTIYIRCRDERPATDGAYSYLMRSFDCAGNSISPRVETPGLIMECHETDYYGAIGTTYLAHALGEADGQLIIRSEGRHSYLAGEELECALNLSATGQDGLCRAANQERTGWLRAF
ncbi:hypothetical protein MKQ68_05925 [Chitinophaga horti]|uniref:Uncharacterized protein n=1 Tax=Chitinophaga horti TaxID=2920382 RepID=A0ABY6J8Z0_9BACT|nr:hypothetical protein [Chitinophaga horti]UYQ94629.1 hypothetical protein MKQ68_05925 [Chitinophaga horti]